MAERALGKQATARRALHKALLDEERLDDLLDDVPLLAERGRHGLDPNRAATVILGDAAEVAAIPASTFVHPNTAEKSRTRRNSRIATRGVPRARRAISAAPSSVRSKARTLAPRPRICASSEGS